MYSVLWSSCSIFASSFLHPSGLCILTHVFRNCLVILGIKKSHLRSFSRYGQESCFLPASSASYVCTKSVYCAMKRVNDLRMSELLWCCCMAFWWEAEPLITIPDRYRHNFECRTEILQRWGQLTSPLQMATIPGVYYLFLFGLEH